LVISPVNSLNKSSFPKQSS